MWRNKHLRVTIQDISLTFHVKYYETVWEFLMPVMGNEEIKTCLNANKLCV